MEENSPSQADFFEGFLTTFTFGNANFLNKSECFWGQNSKKFRLRRAKINLFCPVNHNFSPTSGPIGSQKKRRRRENFEGN